MIKAITPFVFNEYFEWDSNTNNIVLFDKPAVKHLTYPVKLNVTVSIISVKGLIKGRTNMSYFESQAPCMIVLLADHTVTIEHISQDFSALFVVFSKKFTSGLTIDERLNGFLSWHNNPCITLDKNELISLKEYFKSVQKVLEQSDNPFRIKIIMHLTIAYFYGFGHNHHFQESNNVIKKSRQENLVETFLAKLQIHFKTERNIGFYANKLNISAKYLSKVMKDHNGLSAKQWIEDYVVWEAKALLKSTTMTIQEISDELNFPSQSFFGKYFKRSVGVSPFEYRKT